jgi:hypothetical protein
MTVPRLTAMVSPFVKQVLERHHMGAGEIFHMNHKSRTAVPSGVG